MSVNTLHGMTNRAGGQALKTAVHVHREQAGITSDRQLSARAGVHYDTLMNWYAGRTLPRPAELKKVADVLGVRLVELMDVYEGRDPAPPELVEVIGELVVELRLMLSELRAGRVLQEESTAAILRALGVAGRPSGPALRDTQGGNDVAARSDSRRT